MLIQKQSRFYCQVVDDEKRNFSFTDFQQTTRLIQPPRFGTHVYTKTKYRAHPRGRLATTPGYTLHSLPHHVGEPCLGHRYTLAVARPHHQPKSCVCPATLPRQLHNVPSSPTETTSQTVGTIVPYMHRLCLCPHLLCRCCACGISCGNATCATPAKNHSGRRRRPCSRTILLG